MKRGERRPPASAPSAECRQLVERLYDQADRAPAGSIERQRLLREAAAIAYPARLREAAAAALEHDARQRRSRTDCRSTKISQGVHAHG